MVGAPRAGISEWIRAGGERCGRPASRELPAKTIHYTRVQITRIAYAEFTGSDIGIFPQATDSCPNIERRAVAFERAEATFSYVIFRPES